MSKSEPNNDHAHRTTGGVVSEQACNAWEIWKKLTDFSEYLWDAYYEDFMTLAASEPPPAKPPYEDLPF